MAVTLADILKPNVVLDIVKRVKNNKPDMLRKWYMFSYYTHRKYPNSFTFYFDEYQLATIENYNPYNRLYELKLRQRARNLEIFIHVDEQTIDKILGVNSELYEFYDLNLKVNIPPLNTKKEPFTFTIVDDPPIALKTEGNYQLTSSTNKETNTCKCSITQLMQTGCVCGQIDKEKLKND